ncbi:MAG: DUF2939 domain-containing protein, partial [Acetobacteraceae bacterium]
MVPVPSVVLHPVAARHSGRVARSSRLIQPGGCAGAGNRWFMVAGYGLRSPRDADARRPAPRGRGARELLALPRMFAKTKMVPVRSLGARLRIRPSMEHRMRARMPIIIGLCLLAAAYIAYPFVTLYRLNSALARGDTRTLARLVDWPAVQEGLQEDL